MLQKIGIPRLIISLFLASLVAGASYLGLPMGQIGGSMLTRLGMNALLVLAMIPTIQSGSGPNFGLPFGIVCGLVAMTLSIEMNYAGFPALFISIAVAIPLGAVAGYLYGQLLNRVKGQEMTVGTYMGFSIVSLMCIFWMLAPYVSPEMIWPYGGAGLRTTILLDGRMEQLLDRLWAFYIYYDKGLSVTASEQLIETLREGKIWMLRVPTGLLLTVVLFCAVLWFFLRSKTGLAMRICGANPRFAESSGLDVNRYRLIGAVVSSAMAAVGIIVYSQSYGFIQLYEAPLYMALASVSAILIGGASLSRATITQALIGTFLFHSLLVVAPAVANRLVESEIAEIMRAIISNGIILYALTRRAPGGELG